jgi:hypothetical protein
MHTSTPRHPSFKRISHHVKLALLLVVVALIPLRLGEAQFIQTTSSGVYQTPDGKVKVVLGSNDGAQGIFVSYFQQGIPPQEFNAEKLPTEGASHAFIRFDPSAEYGFSELVIGEKIYKAVGNFNLAIGDEGLVKVNVDNTNPYLSITYRSSEKPGDSLIGFYGLTEVVKGSGNLVAIVTANQLNKDMAKIIKPYTVKENSLWLDDKKVETPAIGLFVKRDHVCLKDSTSLLTLAQLKKIQAAKQEVQQAQLLEGFLKENKTAKPTHNKLVLRADPDSPMILLDMSQNVYDLRQIKNSFSRNLVCVLSPLS